MGKKSPLSPALGGGSRRDDAGGQLLRELEALSQVLYNAGQPNGRPPRKDSPSSPSLGSHPRPRRSHEALSPLLADRAFQDPPSPHRLGGSRDRQFEDPPSPYERAYANRRVQDDHPPRSPYLGGLNGPLPEPRSPVIVTLNGAHTHIPTSGRSESRRDGAGKPPRVESVPLHLGGARSYESPKSPQILVRRSVDSVPRSPHLSGGGQYSNGVASPSLRSRRSDVGSEESQFGRNGETLPMLRGKGPQSPLGAHLGRVVSDSVTSKSLGSLGITELTLTSAAAALRSPIQRPPVVPHATRSSQQSESDSGKRIEPYSLGGSGRESGGENGGRGGLKPWHSQGFEKSLPEVANFPGWLQDNVQFSKQLEAPKEKRSLWNWKPFRAIAHIGAQRVNCMFMVHVHGIEGLPAVTNGLRLAVSWKRKEAQAQSMPARVFQGSAEFEESLYLKSTVFGTKDGHKGVKFEPKCFDLAVVALDVDELVLGKHRLDLSRLVPATTSGRDEENDDRSWTTRFKLAGKAKGGTLIVTFACQLLNKHSDSTSNNNLSSARFSDSPMLKPLRSYNSLPSSPEGGTSRSGSHAAHAMFSPAMSEMPIDAEYMSMEDLSLNDEFSPAGDLRHPGKSTRLSFSDHSPELNVSPKQLSRNRHAAFSERDDLRKALSFDDDDDGSEFTVVCQGHESSAIVDAVGYDDPKAEEDTVQRLPDADADVHEDTLQDSVAPQAHAGVDVPEVVKFLSDEKVPRKEPAEELRNVPRHSRNSLVVKAGSDDDDDDDALSLQVGGAGSVSDHSKPVDVEIEHRTETSAAAAAAAIEELDNGAIEEEDIVDVQEDWNVSVVEDLDVLTKSWSVVVPANHVIEEEHEICREELLSDDKEDEVSEITVGSLGDEKAADVVTLVEKDDEEDEKKRTDNLIVVTDQSTSTPLLQVKTKGEDHVEEDEYDVVYGEFLSLLRDPSPPCDVHSESGEDSPRAQLLKQFEQEALIEGGLELNFHLPEYAKFSVEGAQESNDGVVESTPRARDVVSGNVVDHPDWDHEEDAELAAIIEAAEAELEKATQILESKARAKVLEDEETRALMQVWGLNDRAFEAETEPEVMSMAIVPAVVPVPVLRFCNSGGSVHSVSPAHWQGGADERLLMQASEPVVVASEVGATSMDILRRMAVAGMEDMQL